MIHAARSLLCYEPASVFSVAFKTDVYYLLLNLLPSYYMYIMSSTSVLIAAFSSGFHRLLTATPTFYTGTSHSSLSSINPSIVCNKRSPFRLAIWKVLSPFYLYFHNRQSSDKFSLLVKLTLLRIKKLPVNIRSLLNYIVAVPLMAIVQAAAYQRTSYVVCRSCYSFAINIFNLCINPESLFRSWSHKILSGYEMLQWFTLCV